MECADEQRKSEQCNNGATASADMVRMLFTYLEHRKIDAAMVERTILKGHRPRIAPVAGELAFGVRKLQLSLQEEGTNFREVVNDARKRLAKRFLRQPDTTLCDVAFRLGFSE